MMMFKICFLLLLLDQYSKAEDVQLNITDGPILGKKVTTVGLNNTMYAFQGIYYAEPPVRFQMAVEKAPWTELLNCTYDKDQCIQGSDPVLGSEDCLSLSVYSPNLTGSYPVFAWIHGGYFTMGNGSYSEIAPDFMIEEGVVFVAIQYRLGILGFMSTGDLTCPGNLGFKDQVLALKWIQKNIKFFGGDPNRVTLGGESAGSVAASLHLQSPMSTGLFNGIVLESGTSLNLWGFNRRAKQTAYAVGVRFCPLALTSTALVACLSKQDITDLQKASVTISLLITLQNPLAGISYGYVSEPVHPNAFFTGKSEQRLSVGDFTKVPLIVGFNSNEAIFFGNITALIRLYLMSYDFEVTRLVPADLTKNYFDKIPSGFKIQDHFTNSTFGLLALQDDDLVEFVSSDQFERPIWQFGLDVSQFVDATYFYQFSHEGINLYRTYEGVGHAEEMNYLFHRKNEILTEADSLTRRRLVRLWCNFFKTWNPTPESDSLLENKTWLPMRNGNINGTYHYFNINSTLDSLTNPKDNNMQFWNNPTDGIYPVYGQGEYDTY